MKDIFSPDQIIVTNDSHEDFNKVFVQTILDRLKEQEICVVRYEDCGVYVIDHAHDEAVEPWGGLMPVWLTAAEQELINSRRQSYLLKLNELNESYESCDTLADLEALDAYHKSNNI